MPCAPKDSQVSVRLSSELKERMETYAELTGRTKSHVAMEALSEYLTWRVPQIDDLKQAIAAADRGEFASEAEVDATLSRFSSVPATAKAAHKRAKAAAGRAPKRR
jgi:predicted transcriptional regulator